MEELHGYYLEDLEVGMSAVYSKTVSEADVVMFAGISGDTNPLHLNQLFAEGTHFKERIAHGMLSASFISTVLGTRFEVSDQDGQVRTVVVDGSVAVSNEHGSVEVVAGGLARASAEAPPSTRENASRCSRRTPGACSTTRMAARAGGKPRRVGSCRPSQSPPPRARARRSDARR